MHINRRSALAFLAVVMLAIGSAPSRAAYQSCGGQVVEIDAARCPDGAIPSYNPGPAPAAPAPPKSSGQVLNDAGTHLVITGIWHTGVPGLGYRSAMDVPGSYLLEIPPGLGAGDLTIAPNGAFIWNTLRGISGRWIATPGDYPFTLLDETNHKRWHAVLVDGVLKLWDEHDTLFGHR
jgi:hypothetical protein